MTRPIAALLALILVAGCGVDDQPEPVRLTDVPAPPVLLPTVTQRPSEAPDG